VKYGAPSHSIRSSISDHLRLPARAAVALVTSTYTARVRSDPPRARRWPIRRDLPPAGHGEGGFDADGVTRASATRKASASCAPPSWWTERRTRSWPAAQGQRKPRPGLGKVAIFAYFRGARRSRDVGATSASTSSRRVVLVHPARARRDQRGLRAPPARGEGPPGTLQELFDEMVERCVKISEN